MIRSVYEYNHREWLTKSPQYSFCGMPVIEMEADELRAALAFMVQFAGDLGNKIREVENER